MQGALDPFCCSRRDPVHMGRAVPAWLKSGLSKPREKTGARRRPYGEKRTDAGPRMIRHANPKPKCPPRVDAENGLTSAHVSASLPSASAVVSSAPSGGFEELPGRYDNELYPGLPTGGATADPAAGEAGAGCEARRAEGARASVGEASPPRAGRERRLAPLLDKAAHDACASLALSPPAATDVVPTPERSGAAFLPTIGDVGDAQPARPPASHGEDGTRDGGPGGDDAIGERSLRATSPEPTRHRGAPPGQRGRSGRRGSARRGRAPRPSHPNQAASLDAGASAPAVCGNEFSTPLMNGVGAEQSRLEAEASATRFFLPSDRIGPRAGMGAAGRYGGGVANHFYQHFDVEDIGEAFTISDWLPVDEIPMLAVKMRSHMNRRWWLHEHMTKRAGAGKGALGSKLAELRGLCDAVKADASGDEMVDHAGPERATGNGSDAMNLGQPGLRTPQWVEHAYHALYSTRIPVSESKTPWARRKNIGSDGTGKGADDSTLAARGYASMSTGHDFLRGQRLMVKEFRALEDTIVYIACLRPRTHEDAKPLIELMAALLIHIVGELQVTYWDMQHHFQTLRRKMEEDMRTRMEAMMADLEAQAELMSRADQGKAAKERFRGILFKMAADSAAKSKEEAAELEEKLREEMKAGRSVSEKIVAQQAELDDLRAENERIKLEFAMASDDLSDARDKIRKGDAIARALSDRGLESKDADVLGEQLDEMLRRSGGIQELFDANGNLIVTDGIRMAEAHGRSKRMWTELNELTSVPYPCVASDVVIEEGFSDSNVMDQVHSGKAAMGEETELSPSERRAKQLADLNSKNDSMAEEIANMIQNYSGDPADLVKALMMKDPSTASAMLEAALSLSEGKTSVSGSEGREMISGSGAANGNGSGGGGRSSGGSGEYGNASADGGGGGGDYTGGGGSVGMDAESRKSFMKTVGSALEELPPDFAGKMLMHCSEGFGRELLQEGELSDSFHVSVAAETPFLASRYVGTLDGAARPSLDTVWKGKEVTSMDELSALCDESIKLLGYWREHLGMSSVYVHTYSRTSRGPALKLLSDGSQSSSKLEVPRPPRREFLFPKEARMHFDIVKGGAEVIGAAKTVKDVETRRAWNPGERPIKNIHLGVEESFAVSSKKLLETFSPKSSMKKTSVDGPVMDAEREADAEENVSASEPDPSMLPEQSLNIEPAAKERLMYASDDYHPEDDLTPATAIAIERPPGESEATRDSSSRSAVWGVITTPGVGKNPRGGRGDPEELMILTELSNHITNAKANIDRLKRSGGQDMDLSTPPPPVLPLSINPNRADGMLSMENGPDICWELETWDDEAVDAVQIFVLSRADPRQVIRESRFVHAKPDIFASKCEAEFQAVGEEEILVLCSDSWRIGGAMADAARVLKSEFGSGMCSMDPKLFGQAAQQGIAKKNLRVVAPTYDEDAPGNGSNFCLVAYRGLEQAAEQVGGTFKGFLVLDVSTGLYSVSHTQTFSRLQLVDLEGMRRRAIDRQSVRTGEKAATTDEAIRADVIQCQCQLSNHKRKLRLMYQHYCTSGAVGINNPFRMDYHQWDSFVGEIMKGEPLFDKTMSVSVFLSAIVHREDWSPESFTQDMQKAEDLKLELPKGKKEVEKLVASRYLTFDQWKEALIRLAVMCYGKWEDETVAPEDMLTMAETLSKLLDDRVLAKGKTIVMDEVFDAEFAAPEMASFLSQKKVAVELKNFFSCAAFNSIGGARVGYESWILFCKKAGFVGKTLSISRLLRIFVQVADDMFDDYSELDANEAINLCNAYKLNQDEEDMRYDEWVEGIARVGFALLRPEQKEGTGGKDSEGGKGRRAGKTKTAVEVMEEIINVYLIKNELAIGKMKEVLR